MLDGSKKYEHYKSSKYIIQFYHRKNKTKIGAVYSTFEKI